MANRTMAAKSLKLRKQIRKGPRWMPTGIVPNRGVLQEYKERAKGLGVTDYEIDEWIKRLYGRLPFAGVPPERKAVIDLLNDLKTLVPEMLFFDVFPANCYQRCRLYFNSQKTCYVLVWDNFKARTVQRSMEYGSKERACAAWHTDHVVWVSRSIKNNN